MTETETKALKKKVKKLEETINSLRSQLSSKEIVIDALISKLKPLEKAKAAPPVQNPKPIPPVNTPPAVKSPKPVPPVNTPPAVQNPKPVPPVNTPPQVKNPKPTPIVDSSPAVKRPKPAPPVESPPGIEMVRETENEVPKDELSKDEVLGDIELQLKAAFTAKTNKMEFRTNFTFQNFVKYAETSFEFSLLNKKPVKIKNPLKKFIETNLDKIIKYLLDNINSLNINQICSTMFMVNTEMEYKYKLVVFHDVVLLLDNYVKLNFIASALFNNINLEGDVFSQLIRKIMYHQLCIDSDMLKETGAVEYLGLVKDNFKLSAPEISLWSSLAHFLIAHDFFDKAKRIVLVDAIERGFYLRMVCHYVDWDYTYNTFILTQLYPKLMSERAPVHAYYIGILMLNAKRMFGSDESIERLVDVLDGALAWKNDCSVAAYLILKQIRPVDAGRWLGANEVYLRGSGYDIEYLESFLII